MKLQWLQKVELKNRIKDTQEWVLKEKKEVCGEGGHWSAGKWSYTQHHCGFSLSILESLLCPPAKRGWPGCLLTTLSTPALFSFSPELWLESGKESLGVWYNSKFYPSLFFSGQDIILGQGEDRNGGFCYILPNRLGLLSNWQPTFNLRLIGFIEQSKLVLGKEG